MGRLARIESDVHDLKGAVIRMADILVDHSQHLTELRRAIDERLGGVNERLDRLIAVTMQKRTLSTERLGDIERRLARLEQRFGT